MSDLLQRLSGNPLATPVGQKIEQATDPYMTSENWALNMEICDLINETEEGARDAVRAIKKRLQQTASKNANAFVYTLTVLETCVKNCGKRFHIMITNKDFIQDLVKHIGPKNDLPVAVQEKVLSMIQNWAQEFHGQPELQGVAIVYNDLRNKGIAFPKSDSQSKGTVSTPRSIPSSSPDRSSRSTAVKSLEPSVRASSAGRASEIYPIHLSPEQLTKLKNELELVQSNMKVFSEMLTELTPGQEHKDDLQLLTDLYQTCNQMQKRIVELVEKIANEEVTNELLRINDELNNLFMRYQRYDKKRNPNIAAVSDLIPSDSRNLPSTSSSNVTTTSNTGVPSLIDFSEDEVDATLANLSISQQVPIQSTDKKENGDKEFDMFAQLRSSNGNEVASTGQPDLGHSEAGDAALRSTDDNDGNINFEQFLQQRATVLEQQPLKQPHDSSLI